jgi:hypothetical protein
MSPADSNRPCHARMCQSPRCRRDGSRAGGEVAAARGHTAATPGGGSQCRSTRRRVLAIVNVLSKSGAGVTHRCRPRPGVPPLESSPRDRSEPRRLRPAGAWADTGSAHGRP